MAKTEPTTSIGIKLGKFRQFYSSNVPSTLADATTLVYLDRLYLFALTATALLLRTYKVNEPPKVVFDEVHFGGFVRNYFDGKFFIDVHPPLGKLIYYYIAKTLGWDGKFDFSKIGTVYDTNTPYVAMRLFSAVCGALTVSSTYLALRASFCRSATAAFGAALVLVENSLATQSRFILLDAPLIFFTSITVCSFQFFQVSQPFTRKWLFLMFSTGIFLGLSISTKLTGLFTLVWVGLWSAYQIWIYLGDLNFSLKMVAAQIIFRIFFFLAVPLTVYLRIFSLHFQLLPHNGTGSGSVSPAFKAGFKDSNSLRNYAADISYGSIITLRHQRLNTYLHSHKFKYRTGTKQQQVTMYGFSGDSNSEWIIETAGTNYDGKFDGKFRPIGDGETVKLYHKNTGKYLRANQARPPNSEHDYSYEVSCDGNKTDTANSDYEWTVSIVDTVPHASPEARSKLRATQSIIRIMHKGKGCFLMGQNVFLPDWAFHQHQVLCMSLPTETNTLWYIEMNLHPQINGDKTFPRVNLPELTFVGKLKEYHAAMWRANHRYVKKHPYESLPFSWPVPVRGISYFSNGHDARNLTDELGSHIYLLGNTVTYVTGLIVVIVFTFKFALYFLKHTYPFGVTPEHAQVSVFYMKTLQFLSGWFLQFYPFVFFERKLYAHHYLSSLYFLILGTAQFAEYVVMLNYRSGYLFISIIGAGALYLFWTLSPLIYGTSWTVQQCQKAKILPSWDFDCLAYSN